MTRVLWLRVATIARFSNSRRQGSAGRLAPGLSYAVLAASIFHEKDTTIARLKEYLANEGMEVRPC